MVWLAILGKLHIKSVLFIKGILQANQIFCDLCGWCPETIDLLSCHTAWRVWCAVGPVRGLHIVVPGSVREMFVLWMSLKGNDKFNQKVLKSVFFAVVWSLWKVRNDLIFGTQAFNLEQILLLIKFRVECWINLWEDNFLYNPAVVVHCFNNLLCWVLNFSFFRCIASP